MLSTRARPTTAPITSVRRSCSGRPRRPSPEFFSASYSRAQCLGRVAAAGESLVRLLGEQFVDDVLQAARAARHHLAKRFGLSLRDLQRERGDAGSGEGGLPGDQLVEHDAEREEIGAMVELEPERLLGAHVARRAEHLAELGARRGALGARAVRLGHAGDAEIEDLGGPAAIAEHDVRRLDVAVDDAEPVGIIERAGDLGADPGDGLERHPARLAQMLVERDAVEQFHGDIGKAVRLADVVDGDDVGVRERAGGPGLAQEAADQADILPELGLQHLDREDAVDAGIVGAIDVRHRAFADAPLDLVTADDFHGILLSVVVRGRSLRKQG